MIRPQHLTLVLSACAVALPSIAIAEEIPALGDLNDRQQRILLGHLDRGRTLYEGGEFVDALDAFKDAYAIFPHPDVLYRVAECQEKMGEDVDAIANYKKFLRQSPDAPERKRIEGVISVLERRLAKRREARISVVSDPPGARAYLGRVDLGPTPVEIPVTPGTYNVRLELNGYDKIAQDVEISPGKTVELRYTLVPEGGGGGGGDGGGGFVLSPGGPGASPVDGMLANPLTPWVVGGVGAASLVGSIFFWSASSSAGAEVDAYDAQRRDRTRPDDYDDLVGARNGFGTAGIVTTTLGLAFLGGGVALYLLQQDQPDPPASDAPDDEGTSAPPSTVFAPAIGPDSAGVQVFATF